jgi:predicted ester cyclase
MPDDNAVVLQRAVDAFNKGGASGLGSVFGKDLEHGVSDRAKRLHTAFPDLQYKIDGSHSEGNRVAFTYTASGTFKGTLGEYKGTNKSAQWHGVGVASVSEGKIVAVHVTEDWVRAALLLGVVDSIAHLLKATMAGTWGGTGGGITVTLHLSQAGNAVSGSATATGFSETFPVSGTNNHPKVSLAGSVGGLPITFAGDFSGPDSVPGTLTVQGFAPVPVTIKRK